MKSVSKFLALPAADQWLLVKALAVMTAVRLRLALLPFQPANRTGLPGSSAIKTGPTPERIAWAVDRVGGFFGTATCLARAMAAQSLLRRQGFRSRIRIGVAATDQRSMIAHAWLEFGGAVLVGGPDIGQYTPLLTWSN